MYRGSGHRTGCDDRPGRTEIERLGWLAIVGAALLATAGSGAPAVAERSLRSPLWPASPDSPLFAGLTWRCIGPFDGGPIASVQGVSGEPGVYVITTPGGGVWKTSDGGDNWTSLEDAAAPAPSVDPHRWLDPANPRRIARTAANAIEVSLDTGATWTALRHLPIAEVARLSPREHPAESSATPRGIAGVPASVAIADPARPGLVFAGTKTGAFVSLDGGTNWITLRLNMPAVAINDLDIRGNNLVAATQGRSIWLLEDISPLRQLSASSAAAPAILFKPADATLPDTVNLDYYLGDAAGGEMTLDLFDSAGRIVHHRQSMAADQNDHWLPVTRPLSSAAGHHRIAWNLRVTPPPSPHHRFAQLAPTLFADEPADPDGPLVLAGTYRVRLTVGGHAYSQLLAVRDDPKVPAKEIRAHRQQFALAMKAYDAMVIAHRGFLQLTHLRAAVRPLLTSPDAGLAALLATLDAQLNVIDGSDWTGLIIPDAPDENPEIEEEEEFVKHPDFVPPKPVSLSKDYDDPTTIFGRRFENVTHAPAFAILGTTLGAELMRASRGAAAPDALALKTYKTSCQELAGVLKEWRRINAEELPRLNADLARQGLARLPIASAVPSIACAPSGR